MTDNNASLEAFAQSLNGLLQSRSSHLPHPVRLENQSLIVGDSRGRGSIECSLARLHELSKSGVTPEGILDIVLGVYEQSLDQLLKVAHSEFEPRQPEFAPRILVRRIRKSDTIAQRYVTASAADLTAILYTGEMSNPSYVTPEQIEQQGIGAVHALQLAVENSISADLIMMFDENLRFWRALSATTDPASLLFSEQARAALSCANPGGAVFILPADNQLWMADPSDRQAVSLMMREAIQLAMSLRKPPKTDLYVSEGSTLKTVPLLDLVSIEEYNRYTLPLDENAEDLERGPGVTLH